MRRKPISSVVFLVLAVLLAAGTVLGGAVIARQDALAQAPPDIEDVPWLMHQIDSRFRGANALSPGDVNNDGFTDYVTNYEFSQRYVISVHPGAGGNVREPWPTIDVWEPEPPLDESKGVNPENAAFGDFDGDGNLDVAGAQGYSDMLWWEGSEPGIRVIWGPPASDVFNENLWTDGGRIPATVDRGHFHWVVAQDVNGDGATDIAAGGRVHGGNMLKAGVIWIEAPSNPADRRVLSNWQVHDIDANQFGGHGFVFADVDEDGDDDIILANADFDTPENEEKVLWYENPGPGPDITNPWPAHVIHQSSEYSGKPQVVVANLDGDAYDDVLTQTDQNIYYFRKTGVAPVTFDTIVIAKDPVAQLFARTLRVADLNGDGKLDILGMLVHVDATIPSDKAAAFWMEYSGAVPLADNWTTHVIKWGSGETMIRPELGEKWDQAHIVDVDGDGDLDIVANCEEWWEDGWGIGPFWDPTLSAASAAVVWFENRLNEAPYAFDDSSGVSGNVVIEAELYTNSNDGTWLKRANYPGYGGNGYVQDHNAINDSARGWTDTQGHEYAVNLGGGLYHLWLRRWAPASWGHSTFTNLGGANSNSAWLGVDGAPLAHIVDDENSGYDSWVWILDAPAIYLSAGDHVINLRVREGGYAVDQIRLTPAFDLGAATVSFFDVTAVGQTTATPMASIPAGWPPVGRVIGSYVEIDTMATYVGPVAVGIPYDESSVDNEARLKLFHHDGSNWHDVTAGLDTVSNVVYGEATSLSPFVVVEEAGPEGEGCFIATAAYGSYLDSHVETLRDFRDQYLVTNPVGSALVSVYYDISPPVAEFIDDHPALKPILRIGLLPAVAMSTVAVNTTSAEKVAIVGSLAVVSSLIAVWLRRKAVGGKL